jgi:hypothetical protein
MPRLDLALTGATIVLSVRGQPFTLTAPTAHISFDPATTSGTPATGGASSPNDGIHFKYEETFEKSVSLGTPEEVLVSIEQMLKEVPSFVPAAGESLVQQWAQVRTKLDSVPVLNKVSDAVLSTQVRLTRFEIGFVPVILSDQWTVYFTLGLMFVPEPGTLPVLFGTSLTRFGVVFTIAGSAPASELGLD